MLLKSDEDQINIVKKEKAKFMETIKKAAVSNVQFHIFVYLCIS
jgi:hypothetical protein